MLSAADFFSDDAVTGAVAIRTEKRKTDCSLQKNTITEKHQRPVFIS